MLLYFEHLDFNGFFVLYGMQWAKINIKKKPQKFIDDLIDYQNIINAVPPFIWKFVNIFSLYIKRY
jgi:hypothetical protein